MPGHWMRHPWLVWGCLFGLLVVVVLTVPAQAPSVQGIGRGAGSGATAVCSPLDATCLAQSVASWAATQLLNAFGPIVTNVLESPLDLIYQTPAVVTSSPILAINTALIGVVDAALACLIAIGGINLMWGIGRLSVQELFSRLVLVVGAVHFNQQFLGLFIEFENDLAQAIIHASNVELLTNVIAGLFTPNPLAGPLVIILTLVLGIMVILLLLQMITRLALVAICVALAPLALGCLLLPQTLRWGRLWFTVFSSAVIVQVLQVTVLVLGSVVLSSILATSFAHLETELATALLAIGLFGLVLKIPGMLQTWALHPMMESGFRGASSSGSAGNDTSSVSGGSPAVGTGGGGASGGIVEGTIVTEEAGAAATLLLA